MGKGWKLSALRRGDGRHALTENIQLGKDQLSLRRLARYSGPGAMLR